MITIYCGMPPPYVRRKNPSEPVTPPMPGGDDNYSLKRFRVVWDPAWNDETHDGTHLYFVENAEFPTWENRFESTEYSYVTKIWLENNQWHFFNSDIDDECVLCDDFAVPAEFKEAHSDLDFVPNMEIYFEYTPFYIYYDETIIHDTFSFVEGQDVPTWICDYGNERGLEIQLIDGTYKFNTFGMEPDDEFELQATSEYRQYRFVGENVPPYRISYGELGGEGQAEPQGPDRFDSSVTTLKIDGDVGFYHDYWDDIVVETDAVKDG